MRGRKIRDMSSTKPTLGSLAWLFLRIGATAFGGHLALLAVVEREVVEKRQWISQQEWQDSLAMATMMPGPMAVNMIAQIGYLSRGGLGALVVASMVLLPSVLLMIAAVEAYVTWGQSPLWQQFFAGVIPVVLAIIAGVIWRLGKRALRTPWSWFLAIAAALSSGLLPGQWIPLIFAGAALTGLLVFRQQTPSSIPLPVKHESGKYLLWALLALVLLTPYALEALINDMSASAALFSVFGKISVVLFGGGFVMVPVLQDIVVDQQQWLSNEAFTHAIAVGQLTPGPILVSATFIGWKLAALPGALAATIGIFLPSAVLMISAAQLLSRHRQNPKVLAAMQGINAAVVGVIALSIEVIGRAVELNLLTISIFVLTLLGSYLKLSPLIMIPLAGVAAVLLA